METDLIQEQIDYYRQRAAEYDEWFLRQGRYDRGEAHRIQWFSEVAILEKALSEAAPSGDILELACGTGLWTQHLAPVASSLTAVDASAEAIALNQQRLNDRAINYVVADLFDWTCDRQFDFIFFSFWLSHVPQAKFADFWCMVKTALKPSGRVFFIDSLLCQDSTAINHPALHREGYSERKLNDGRTYRVVKVFYQPRELKPDLERLGWLGNVETTTNYFLYGSFERNTDN